jgi:hypothetical protein
MRIGKIMTVACGIMLLAAAPTTDAAAAGRLAAPALPAALGPAAITGAATAPAAAPLFRDVQHERVGVIAGGRVRDMKDPAGRCRAGCGVHGVGGVLILLR